MHKYKLHEGVIRLSCVFGTNPGAKIGAKYKPASLMLLENKSCCMIRWKWGLLIEILEKRKEKENRCTEFLEKYSSPNVKHELMIVWRFVVNSGKRTDLG